MINSSSDNVKKLNSINRRMFITGSLKFFIMIGSKGLISYIRSIGFDVFDIQSANFLRSV
mgnify:CR=1 FL=1